MKPHLFHTYTVPYESVCLSPSSLTPLDVIFLSHLQLHGFYLSFSLLIPAPGAQAGTGHLKAQTLWKPSIIIIKKKIFLPIY